MGCVIPRDLPLFGATPPSKVDDLARSINLARVRGFTKSRHSSRVLANFISAVTFGRVLTEFDSGLPDDELEQWTQVIMDVLDRILIAD
ncbi:MAG: hypothetical protein RLZZ327_74 [Actinomycetota bacterium]